MKYLKAMLAGVWWFFVVGDLGTTTAFLSQGAAEGNPIFAPILVTYGFVVFFALALVFKLVILEALCRGYKMVESRNAFYYGFWFVIIGFFLVAGIAAVVWNSYGILFTAGVL